MTIALIRTLILYAITALAVRCMGKRQIGELEPMDFVIAILISDLATVPMQDLDAPLLNSIIPICILVILEIFSSTFSLRSKFIQRFLRGRSSILIRNGKIDQAEMKKTHVTVEELFEKLRQNSAVCPDEVRYCILEPNGSISVIRNQDMQPGDLPVILISDGTPLEKNLQKLRIDKEELYRIIRVCGGNRICDVFLLYLYNETYHLIEKEDPT